jgi:hypothetical protein
MARIDVMLQRQQDERDLRGRADDSIPQIGRRRGDGSEDETRGVARSGGSGGGECFVVPGFLYRGGTFAGRGWLFYRLVLVKFHNGCESS